MLPCLYYSPKANQATKKILSLNDTNLMIRLLWICQAKWQTWYNLMENTNLSVLAPFCMYLRTLRVMPCLTISSPMQSKPKGLKGSTRWSLSTLTFPRKLAWSSSTENYQINTACYARSRGLHKSQNICNCCHFNKDGTPINKNGDASRPQPKDKG